MDCIFKVNLLSTLIAFIKFIFIANIYSMRNLVLIWLFMNLNRAGPAVADFIFYLFASFAHLLKYIKKTYE